MELTTEQRKAVEHFGSNVFVNAGAGSGKTRILVARYIEILKRGMAGIDEIVAITFTRKAAKEMKERIRKNLSGGDFAPELQYELETAPISTIHRFCSKILRENATRVGIDPDFRVLEEMEEVIFRESALQDAVIEAVHRGEKGMIKLVSEFGIETVLKIFRVLYTSRGKMEGWIDYYAGKTDGPPQGSDLSEVTKMRLEMALGDPEVQRLKVILSNTRSLQENDRIEKIRCEVLSLIEALENRNSGEEAITLLEKFKEIKISGGRPSSWDGEDLNIVKDAIKNLREIFKKVFEDLNPLSRDQEEELEGLLRLVIREFTFVEKKLEKRKRAENLLDYDDLMIITRRALSENSDLRRRLRRKYKFFLVDEFQDTDRQQWKVLRIISSDEDRLGRNGLFLVGDFGQSIYRFRGAEVKIFSDVGKEIEKGGGENFSLTKNFRSTPAIISFVNYLQSKVQAELDRESREPERIYLHGNREKETGRPPVEILVVKGEKGVDKETCRRKEANLLACKIKEIVEKESREYGQIAVLFRSMTYSWIYEMAFRKEGIPHALLKGGKFFGLPEIRDMINALKVIEDDGNEVALYGLLRSPLFGVSDDTIYKLCTGTRLGDGFSFWRKKDGVSREEGIILQRAVDFLEEGRERKDSDGIYELISWILDMTDFQEVLLGTYAGERKVLNVNKLLQLALSFESKGLFTLNDFIRYIDLVSVQELYESEAPVELHDRSVVKVMTIHGAKGLEFPVVFLPDLTWFGRSEPFPIVHHPDYGFDLKGKDEGGKGKKPRKYRAIAFANSIENNLESGRLFYVATTRACDKLILSASLSQPKSKEDMSSTWVRWIWDLLPDDIRGTTMEEKGQDLSDEIESVYEVTSVVCGTEDDRSSPFESASTEWHADAEPLVLPPDILSRIDPVDPSEPSGELSVTQILDYLECPRLFQLKHVLKLRRPSYMLPDSFSRVSSVSIGELTHRVLQDWNLSNEENLKVLIERIIVEIEEESKAKVEGEVMSLLEPFRGSEIIHDMVDANDRKRLFRELDFTVPFQGVPVRGSIDVIYKDRGGDWIIIDYKTIEVSEGNSDNFMKRFEHQVMLYAMAFGKAKGDFPKRGIIYFLPTGYAPELDFDRINEFHSLIQKTIGSIMNEQYFKKDTHCGDCDFRGICYSIFDDSVDKRGS